MDVLAELEHVGAVLNDRHFVYTSGRHGSSYINMDALFPHVELTSRISELLVEPFGGEFDVVAGPAVGGVVLAGFGALASTRRFGHEVTFVWADKTSDGFTLERAGFADAVANRRILLVEDLLTTGGSLSKVCQAVLAASGHPVGASVVCNRGGVTATDLGVHRLTALTEINLSSTTASDCQLCKECVPIVLDIGHGAEFRNEHPTYDGGYVSLGI